MIPMANLQIYFGEPTVLDQTGDKESAAGQNPAMGEGLVAKLAPKNADIAIMGPSQSGKTLLVSAIMNAQSLEREICDPEPNPLQGIELQPAYDAQINPPSEGNEDSLRLMERAYFSIPHCLPPDASGELFEHKFTLDWQDAQDPATPPRMARRLFRAREVQKEPVLQPWQSQTYSLWDGRGGDLTEEINPADTEVFEASKRYKDKIRNASGMIVCVSSIDEEYVEKDINKIETLLAQNRALVGGAAPEDRLRYLSVCFTKAETRFLRDGNAAYANMCDPEQAVKRMPAKRYMDLLQVLDGYRARHGVEVRVFPVSTFGFINGSGAANFYPHPKKPGLLTRVVTEAQLDESDGTGLTWRDHFPKAISDNKVSELWRPFNVMPAFFFAATGRVTGVMSFSLDELFAEHGL
jgi:GTPase SAR1 family protein